MPTKLICKCGHPLANHVKGKRRWCDEPLCSCLCFELQVPTLHKPSAAQDEVDESNKGVSR